MSQIPNKLDDVAKFLFWDFDVAMLFLVSFGLGIALDMFMTFLIAGLFLAYLYQKSKGGKHRGYGMHLCYWYTPVRLGMKITPDSACREFIG